MGSSRIATAMAVTVAAATLSACGTGSSPVLDPAGAEPLAGTSWVLASFLDAAGEQHAPEVDAATATISFADTAVSGSTGCNRFTGTYAQDGAAVTVSVGGVTKMACPGLLQDQESAVLSDLGKVATASQHGTSLTLADSSGATLLTYEQAASDLEGTSWQATGINNGTGGVQSDADTSSVTATFGADGTLSGNGGCNTYSATWVVSDPDGLTVGPVAATQMACDLIETEQRYFQALEQVATYRIEGDTLTLRDAQGSTQLTFTAA